MKLKMIKQELLEYDYSNFYNENNTYWEGGKLYRKDEATREALAEAITENMDEASYEYALMLLSDDDDINALIDKAWEEYAEASYDLVEYEAQVRHDYMTAQGW